MTKNDDRPPSPSVASMTDDDDALFIRTPSSEADYVHVETRSNDSLEDDRQELLDAVTEDLIRLEAPAAEDTQDVDAPETAAQSASLNEKMAESAALQTGEADESHIYPPEKKDQAGCAGEQPPGAFPDPPEELPESPQSQQNPFIAAATAAVGLSTLIAMFTARTIYNGATAAGQTVYTNFQNDLRGVDNDFNAAFDDLSTSFAAVTRELTTAREVLQQTAEHRQQEAGTLMREARESVARDMESVWRDLEQTKRELETAAREARGSIRNELGNTWQELTNIFRGL